jgi:hypothetical protein
VEEGKKVKWNRRGKCGEEKEERNVRKEKKAAGWFSIYSVRYRRPPAH